MEGFAPTSHAAQKLSEAGMETSTLQKHLVRGQQPDTGEKRLYVLDESSLASTRQVHEFVNRLHPNDRVLLVGDRRQHEAVEAGRPFAQLQDAGMKTVKLEEIVRQKDPELKQVVEELAQGEVRGPQFIARDFKEFIRISGMTHVRTSPFYPQSNGKIERWHKSLKRECIRPLTPLTLEDARRLIQIYVDHYNTVRRHSAIGYVTPQDRLAGRQTEIHAARDRKLEQLVASGNFAGSRQL